MGFNMIHNFEIKRGCIVYKDGARNALFDTGNPASFPQERDPYPIFPKIHEYVDRSITDLQGIDSISRQQLLIDYPRQELSFGKEVAVYVPIAKYDLIPLINGLVAISIKIGGEKRKMLLDSGAATSYLPKSVVVQGIFAGKIKDFFMGEDEEFETDLYSLPTECGTGTPIGVNYGVPKDSIEAAMKQYSVDGIIGYEWLRHFRVLFDVPNRSLTLGW